MNTLPPGVYNAVIQGLQPVRGSGKNGLRFKLMMAALALQGTVMVEHSFRVHRGNGKSFTIHGMYDIHDWTSVRPSRGKLKRHHKAKPQPNCGPRGNNPW